jgi:hypothetical protein
MFEMLILEIYKRKQVLIKIMSIIIDLLILYHGWNTLFRGGRVYKYFIHVKFEEKGRKSIFIKYRRRFLTIDTFPFCNGAIVVVIVW